MADFNQIWANDLRRSTGNLNSYDRTISYDFYGYFDISQYSAKISSTKEEIQGRIQSLLISQNSSTGREHIYFGTAGSMNNYGARKREVFSFNASSLPNQITKKMPEEAVVWHKEAPTDSIILSNDSETIYCAGNFSPDQYFSSSSSSSSEVSFTDCIFIRAIRASNGIPQWTTQIGSSNEEKLVGYLFSDYLEDIHIIYHSGNAAGNKIYHVVIDHTDGSITSSEEVANNVEPLSAPFISGPSKQQVYFCYNTKGTNETHLKKIDIIAGSNSDITLTTGNVLEQCAGIVCESQSVIYLTLTNSGLFKINSSTMTETWNHNPASSYNASGPCLSSNGDIYYIFNKTLYAVQSDSTEKWNYKYLQYSNDIASSPRNDMYEAPDRLSFIQPFIDSLGYIHTYIYTPKDNVSNVYVFDDHTTHTSLVNILKLGKSRHGGSQEEKSTLYKHPYLGENNTLYVPTTELFYPDENLMPYNPTYRRLDPENSSGWLYIYKNQTITTTTSTTPTTTTTTTTAIGSNPLESVITSFYKDINNQLIAIENTDASDNINTVKTPFAKTFTFGTIAPGETSSTAIISLTIPKSRAISHIKLALTNTGGIPFTNSTFGITSSNELRSDIIPEEYFMGVNSGASATSPYNIEINNRTNINSNYVYLNVKIPRSENIKSGIIKFKWFFDYPD